MAEEHSTLFTLKELKEKSHTGRSVQVKDALLKVEEGPYQGMEFRLERELLQLGRASWCDIALSEDRKISKEHCELEVGEEGVRVRDLGSRNGVFVDHVQVFDALWPQDTLLKVGNTVLRLHVRDAPKTLKVNYHDKSNQLVGQSPKMRKIFAILERLGSQEVPVLLTGETGTGKTSIARALHEQSIRKDEPFVAINCGALSASLLESLLFGHEKGAFTGATKRHHGYFEQAHKGTLFLDELGELPLELQPKLLDVLESGSFRRLGSEEKVDVDVRVIASTNRELMREVTQGNFRQDLYYRLAVVEIEIPPLRERPEDLPLLVGKILEELDAKEEFIFTEEAMRALQRYLWPGNVRELRNILQRQLVFIDPSSGEIDDLYIDAEDLELPTDGIPAPRSPTLREDEQDTADDEDDASEDSTLLVGPDGPYDSLKEMLTGVEKQTIETALRRHKWDIPATAAFLQISRVWLYKRIKKYEIPVPRLKQRS